MDPKSLYLKITSLINRGESRQAITVFHQYRRAGLKITEFLLSAVLRACTKLAAIHEGMQFHSMIFKHGFDKYNFLMTSLVDLYSKHYYINKARNVFVEMPERDVIATNSMIYGLCRSAQAAEAIELFGKMSERDVGSWNALISGLGSNSEGNLGLEFFERMRCEGFEIDIMTVVSVLSLCADLAALGNGKQVHGLVIQHGFELYLPVGNAIIDMYSKCGFMDDAYYCFKNMPLRNVISWTCLISGYGRHGMGLKALQAFDEMEKEGILPNQITFMATLYACSHAGFVQEGWRYFNTMIHKYSITPTMEHYTCMVDLLARSRRFNEACDFIVKMPIEPDAKLLTAFLSSCLFHKNIELARSIGQKLSQLEPKEAGAYMLLSNLYGIIGDLEGVSKVRKLMLNRRIRKEKACTWIQIDRTVHSFESGDRSHPLSKEIHSYLETLVGKMKKSGYVPNTSMVMQNVDEGTKEQIVTSHSEKLAIALGLITTDSGTRIMIVKNLRVCVDCHLVIKLISKIEGREIVARDFSRFHHFKDGICSCGDHW